MFKRSRLSAAVIHAAVLVDDAMTQMSEPDTEEFNPFEPVHQAATRYLAQHADPVDLFDRPPASGNDQNRARFEMFAWMLQDDVDVDEALLRPFLVEEPSVEHISVEDISHIHTNDGEAVLRSLLDEGPAEAEDLAEGVAPAWNDDEVETLLYEFFKASCHATLARHHGTSEEARSWAFDQIGTDVEKQWPFSFTNCCQVFGLHPGRMRRALLRTIRQHDRSYMPASMAHTMERPRWVCETLGRMRRSVQSSQITDSCWPLDRPTEALPAFAR